MQNLTVPYSLFISSLLLLMVSGVLWGGMMKRFQTEYSDSRRHFSLFRTKYQIAQGSGNPLRLRQIRLAYSEYFWLYVIAKRCLFASILLFIPGIIWYNQISFGLGWLTTVVSLGLVELALIIGYAIARQQADKAFVSSSNLTKTKARGLFERELTAAVEEGDSLKIRILKAQQPLFVYYDNLSLSASMAAFLILILFLVGLVHVIWY